MGTFKYLGYFKETNYEVYLASKLGDSIENIISTEGKKKKQAFCFCKFF